VKQFSLKQDASQADWLIGQGIFFPSINGKALRDMRNPGTAYDDPQMGGQDPQPATMANYVNTSDDDGGVHLNSGIPNKAFADACVNVGGKSWEKVGLVWYKTNQSVRPDCNFQTWANTTVQIGSSISSVVADAIKTAWAGVGIVAGSPTPGPTDPTPPAPGPAAPNATQILAAVDGVFRQLATRVDPGMRGFIELGTLKVADAAVMRRLHSILGV
jgi:hypothetical protein